MTLNSKNNWRRLLKDVEKKEIPIQVIKFITVQLIDGTVIEINVQDLISSGQDAAQLEQHLTDKFDDLDSLITNIDFYIDVDKVAEAVQTNTDHVLKNL